MSVSNPREIGGTKPYSDNYSKLTFWQIFLATFPSNLPRQATTHNSLISLSPFSANTRKEKGRKKLHLLASISLTNPPPNHSQLGVPL